MNTFFKLVAIVVLGVYSHQASATAFLRASGAYLSEKHETGGTTSETTRNLMDFGAGYIDQKGWAFGALYATEKVSSGTSTSNRTSMGPTVGWVSRREAGPFILASYFIKSELENSLTGTGYQIDLGYKYPIKKISLAIQLSYKNFTYDKQGEATLSPPNTHTYIDPYFVIWIEI